MKKLISKVAGLLISAAIAVIIVVVIMAALSVRANGQTIYGFNGTNVPENLTPEVREKIALMHEEGDTVCFVFRNDKYTTQAPASDINNVIALATELSSTGKHLVMVYTFNTRGTVTLDQNFYAFSEFLESGIDIIAGRLGNEEYFKAAGHGGNWNTYWSFAGPVHDRLLTYNIDKIIIPVADHLDTKWNPSATAFINSGTIYEPDFHFYWGRNDLPIYGTLVNDALPQELSNGTYLPNTDAFYQSVYSELTSSDLLDETMSWHNATFPGKQMWVTEYGPPGNPGGLGGAIGFEACTDWFLNATKQYPEIRVLSKFNGPSVTGIITKKGKLDADNLGTYVERLSYMTLKQFYHNKTATAVQPVTTPGTYVFNVHNLTRTVIDLEGYVPLASGLYVASITYSGIAGENYYSSSGQMAWWANGSTKTYEIAGAGAYSYIPALSYGYLTVTVEQVPVYGCTDKAAENYNPEATVEDGSCTYPQPECLRKRWLFSSLPCRPVKSNCNCETSKK